MSPGASGELTKTWAAAHASKSIIRDGPPSRRQKIAHLTGRASDRLDYHRPPHHPAAKSPSHEKGADAANPLFFVFAQFRQDRQVLERAGVADRLIARSNLPQQAAHDLAAPGLRQRVTEA